MVCLSTMAVVCLLSVVVMLIFQPKWETPVLGLPLGAFLLGGLGGLVTLGCTARWAGRLGREPSRIVALTVYRLGSAIVLGGAALELVAAAAGEAPLGWGLVAASLCGGVLEKPINDGLLRVLGLVAPPERGSRTT